MIRRLSKVDLIVDGRKITTEGKEIELKIDGMEVYDDNLHSSLVKLEKAGSDDFETLDVMFAMRVITGIFGHPERYKMVSSLKDSPKTFTELQDSLKLKPATLDFHIKKLQNELVINKIDGKKYELTILGEAIFEYFVAFLKKMKKD